MIDSAFSGVWKVITPEGVLISVIGCKIRTVTGRYKRNVSLIRLDGEYEVIFTEPKSQDEAILDAYYLNVRGALSAARPNETVDLSIGFDKRTMRKESV